MKKLISLLIAMIMLLSMTAFAAETDEAVAVEDYVATTLEEDTILNFGITLDKLPEGYEMYTIDVDSCLYVTFFSETNPVSYYGSVAHSEIFDNYTLVVENLTEADLENLKAMLSADYIAPEFSFTKTAHGTDVIVINETADAAYDYVEFITIYEGYFISLGILDDDTITDVEMETALTLLSDMWIVPVQ